MPRAALKGLIDASKRKIARDAGQVHIIRRKTKVGSNGSPFRERILPVPKTHRNRDY